VNYPEIAAKKHQSSFFLQNMWNLKRKVEQKQLQHKKSSTEIERQKVMHENAFANINQTVRAVQSSIEQFGSFIYAGLEQLMDAFERQKQTLQLQSKFVPDLAKDIGMSGYLNYLKMAQLKRMLRGMALLHLNHKMDKLTYLDFIEEDVEAMQHEQSVTFLN
jgi:hypothetical protein